MATRSSAPPFTKVVDDGRATGLRSGWRRVRATASAPAARAVLVGTALVLIGVTAFAALLDGVRESADLSLQDSPVLAWLVAHRTARVSVLLEAVSLVTEPMVVGVTALGAVLVLFWRARRSRQVPRTALLVGGAVGVAVTASTFVKAAVGRARPPAVDVLGRPETTYSFPSGHTLVAATVLLVAAYLVWSRDRRTTVALRALGWSLAGTATVALSRLYLGYHWLSDVVASVALAVVVLGLVVAADAVVVWTPPLVRGRALIRARVGRRR